MSVAGMHMRISAAHMFPKRSSLTVNHAYTKVEQSKQDKWPKAYLDGDGDISGLVLAVLSLFRLRDEAILGRISPDSW